MDLAIVTGTSRGLGLAIARELLARGASVQGLARSEAPAELAASPAYAHARLDLADLAELERRLASELPARWPEDRVTRLGLVSCAAVLEPMALIRDLAAAPLERALRVNVGAPLLLIAAALRFAPAAPLTIVDVSSGAATSPVPGWATYCATKAALRMADRVLEVELDEVPPAGPRGGPRDVRAVTYAPGVVDTGMQASIRAAPAERFPRRERFLELHREGRLVPPAEPAREVADLIGSSDLPRWSERRFGAPQ